MRRWITDTKRAKKFGVKKSILITILSCLTLGGVAINANEQRSLAGKVAFAGEAKNQPAKILFDEVLFGSTVAFNTIHFELWRN